jgi:inner membrane protein
MVPDFDVFPVALGVLDGGIWGHRGVSHTPAFALLAGLVTALLMWRRDRHPIRLGLAVALVVASHAVLDALAQDGRGMMFLWPLSTGRFHFPWRPIPDAPRGLAFFSEVGMRHLAIELVYFLPFSLYALWPRLRGAPRRSPAGRFASRRFPSFPG